MLNVRYEYKQSLLSLLCVHFVCISVCLLEAYVYQQNVAILPKFVRAVSSCVAYSFKQNQRNTTQQNFLEKWWNFLRGGSASWYRHKDN